MLIEGLIPWADGETEALILGEGSAYCSSVSHVRGGKLLNRVGKYSE